MDHDLKEAVGILDGIAMAPRGTVLDKAACAYLRELWLHECLGSNILKSAVALCANPCLIECGDVQGLIDIAPSFLSDRETWYAQRLRHRVVTAYRGMSLEEFDSGDLGMSWTTNFRVAEFFARRSAESFCTEGGGLVVRADVVATAWLETCESELLVASGCWANVQPAPVPDGFVPITDDTGWAHVKPIPPKLRGAPRASELHMK